MGWTPTENGFRRKTFFHETTVSADASDLWVERDDTFINIPVDVVRALLAKADGPLRRGDRVSHPKYGDQGLVLEASEREALVSFHMPDSPMAHQNKDFRTGGIPGCDLAELTLLGRGR